METVQTSQAYSKTPAFRSLALLFIILLYVSTSYAQDVSSSPYFFVKSEEKEVDAMPLKRTAIDVNIAGVIADIKVTQEYINEGKEILEAIYIFPASTNAAVYGFEMTVGDRKIAAKIAEKKKAREQYESAKKSGKTASLLEQKRPNVFQMSVGNILPGDKIKVELFYTETIVPTKGVYEFVYPTVVGPRYAEEFAANVMYSDGWEKAPYLAEGQEPTYDYDITTSINAGMTVKKISCTTHKLKIKNEDKTIIASLDPSDKKGGNRDYVLSYELSGSKIQSGLLLYEGKDENFFMAMVQPPKSVNPSNIPPREYIFMMDVSGSMRGFPLDVSKKLLEQLVMSLRPEDRFNVMLFEAGNQLLSEESLPATKQNIKKAMEVIDDLRGGGSTRILGAIKSALNMKATANYSRSFIVITDGYITVEQEAFQTIRKNLGQANLYAIGIGSSVNRFLIEGMARAGMGEPLVVLKEEGANAKAEVFRQYISSPVLTNIKVKFNGLDAYDVEPISCPDVLAERPIIIYGKYRNEAKGSITLTGLTGNQSTYTETINVSNSVPTEANQALMYLWARNRIKSMNDFNTLQTSAKQVGEITQMGLKYNLLTNYTSFIAVDPNKRNKSGELVSVKQVLPMPKGVSNKGTGKYNSIANGSVERSMAKSAISSRYNKSHSAFPSKITLAWQVDAEIATESSVYEVKVTSLMGEELLKEETSENMLDIDLLSPKFAALKGQPFMYQIGIKGTKEKSQPNAIRVLNGSESLAVSNTAGALLLAKSIEDKKDLASFYESNGLLANALAVWREIVKEAPSQENKEAFETFLKKHQMM